MWQEEWKKEAKPSGTNKLSQKQSWSWNAETGSDWNASLQINIFNCLLKDYRERVRSSSSGSWFHILGATTKKAYQGAWPEVIRWVGQMTLGKNTWQVMWSPTMKGFICECENLEPDPRHNGIRFKVFTLTCKETGQNWSDAIKLAYTDHQSARHVLYPL